LVYASAPVSIVIIGAGALAWGLGGGDISNAVGEGIEYGTLNQIVFWMQWNIQQTN